MRHFPIDPNENVRVVFLYSGSESLAVLECLPCGEVLHWKDSSFCCPSCDYEVAKSEARRVIDSHMVSMRRLEAVVSEKRSLWERILRVLGLYR
jgi:uncharacterized Zn finger protein (UPF0148 family)